MSFEKESVLFKVNFENSFDFVDWSYLNVVMHKMNVLFIWRILIMECVITTSVSVLVNGSPTYEFHFEQGFHQGDPLSPFLFLITKKGVNVMMNALVSADRVSGYTVGRTDPVSISHLQFANDNRLVGNKSCANIRSLKALLLLFEVTSGLKVNFYKSMLVGVNDPDSWLNKASIVPNCKIGH